MKVLLFGLAAGCAVGSSFALDVGDCVETQKINPNSTPTVTYSAKTVKATEFPSELPTPTFWLDCSRTNGWTFSGSRVTEIPSLVGSRKLVTGKPAASWTVKWTMTGADFVTDVPALGGGSMLDFGELQMGGAQTPGFIFDDNGDSVFVNRLPNVRTAIAVYNSENGGGFFLAGGGIKANMNEIGFIRTDSGIWYSPVVNNVDHVPRSVRYGVFRHDGLPTDPTAVGYNGGWETVSYMAQTRDSDAEYAYATGIGANDTRWDFNDGYQHGGGMRIAELVIFDQKLTHAQCAQVESYLKAKWFGRADRGCNGHAAVADIRTYTGGNDSTVLRIEANAVAGETLSVDRIYGGRDAHYNNRISEVPGIDKTGAGTLAIGDFTEYCGEIRVKEGSLAFNRRTIPASLPVEPFARFDAADADNLETNENGEVTTWWCSGSLTGERWRFCGNDSRKVDPKFRAAAFGEGKPTVDFGPCSYSEGASLSLRNGAGAESTLSGIVTVIAVIGAHEGGGHLANGNFLRNDTATIPYTQGLVKDYEQYSTAPDNYRTTDGTFFVDGVKWEGSAGYDHPGYHVIALQVPKGSGVSTLGFRGAGDPSGGFRLSEFLAYNRVLTETELRDASAYLMNKWMGRTAPGYAAAQDDGAIDVQELKWDNQSGGAIDVPAGATVRVNRFSISGPMTKTGAGTLVLAGGSRDAGDLITIAGGKVEFAHPDPKAQCEMAAGPAFHLDASDTALMDIVKDGEGNDRVAYWYGQDFRNYIFQQTAEYRPLLRANALNGKSVVDFGPYSIEDGRFMNFGVPMEAIRCVFAVWKTGVDRGDLLGSSTYNGWKTTQNVYDFIRNGTTGGLFINNAATLNVGQGEKHIDGVSVQAATKPTGNYEIVDVQTAYGGAHASALGIDRCAVDSGNLPEKKSRGGQAYGEILIYNRTLTEREKVATRNYLRQKWFPEAALEELPADGSKEIPSGDVERTVQIDADAQEGVAPEGRLEAKRLVGSADFTKDGAGTLAIGDLSDYSGTLSVAAGTLELTGAEPGEDVSFVEAGRIFHADATQGVETQVNSAGVPEVVKWTSRHSSEWTAEPGYADKRPTLRSYGADGLTVVDMAPDADQCLRFCHNGEPVHMDEIKSVFWVLGSQNGGGRLLGGGVAYNDPIRGPTDNFNFMRGSAVNDDKFDPTAPLLGSPANYYVKIASWRVNGVSVDPMTAGLSGDWDYLSMVTPREDLYVEAEGFAFDGRSFSQATINPAMVNLCKKEMGRQRLAEVIIYNRCLTEAERLQNETYLRNKWRVRTRRAATNSAAVDLAAGATLDCGGTKQFVAALTGVGTVQNGILEAGALVADADATAWPMVTGTFSVAADVTVDLRNLSFEQDGANEYVVKILQASAFEGLENLSAVNVVGTAIPPVYKVRLIVRDGWLCLKVRSGGTVILLR